MPTTALRIEIKKLKSFDGMEGKGFTCEVYLDGKKAGVVHDAATGGAMNFMGWSQADKAKLDAYAASLPEDGGLKPDADMVIAKAVDGFEAAKVAKRYIKKGYVVVRDGDEIVTYKAALTDALREKIAKESKPGFVIYNDDPAFKV